MKKWICGSKLNLIKHFSLDDVLNLIQTIDDIDIQDSTGNLFSGTADEFNKAAATNNDIYNLISRQVDMIRAYDSVIIIFLND